MSLGVFSRSTLGIFNRSALGARSRVSADPCSAIFLPGTQPTTFNLTFAGIASPCCGIVRVTGGVVNGLKALPLLAAPPATDCRYSAYFPNLAITNYGSPPCTGSFSITNMIAPRIYIAFGPTAATINYHSDGDHFNATLTYGVELPAPPFDGSIIDVIVPNAIVTCVLPGPVYLTYIRGTGGTCRIQSA